MSESDVALFRFMTGLSPVVMYSVLVFFMGLLISLFLWRSIVVGWEAFKNGDLKEGDVIMLCARAGVLFFFFLIVFYRSSST